ncbi:MAG: hypothetical protein NVV82_11230 [Sporocytophaga sp.]|nr:hypothetical protein [Sporocytophaga sp.]
MNIKVNKLKESLDAWNEYGIGSLSSTINYYYVKSVTNKASGHILSNDNSPIVAFQRIERVLSANCRILAATTDFEIYYEKKGQAIMIHYNDQYLGQIMYQMEIMDSNNNYIGEVDLRRGAGEQSIVINKKEVAILRKASDMSFFKKNPFYKDERRVSDRNPMFIDVDPGAPHQRVLVSMDATEEDIKWVTVISIFESIYSGLNFNG